MIVFALLLTGSLVAGAMFGYGFVGEGEEPRDILDRNLWYQIYDFIYTDTEMERSEDGN
ncbi:MAG: DNA-directed RNA polymerase subunit beta [Bacillus sp. (in: Bacteria)]|nr:DNA-directed RNA polymerase subunit beta [Bacillus sp. (in: firmicutes)]